MTKEIEINGVQFTACEKHTTPEYIVYYKKVPLEEQVAQRKSDLENGRIPNLTPTCPLCIQETVHRITNSQLRIDDFEEQCW